MKNEISLKQKKVIDNYLFPIYYWGFTFLSPIVSKAEDYSRIILLIFALILLFLCFVVILRKNAINIAVLIGLGFLSILILDMVIRGNSKSFDYIYRYTYAGFLVILFVSIINDSKQVLKIFSLFSLFAFLLFFYDPFLNYKIFGDYMGYGFNLALPAFIGMSIGFSFFKKRLLIIPMLVCLFMLLAYANRSSFLSALVFVLLYVLITYRKKRLFWFLLISLMLLILIFEKHIAALIMKFLIDLNINTYAINQFIIFLEYGDPISFFSGRFEIWENTWNMFLSKPFLGLGAGYFHAIHDSYPHNIFLDILVTYGIIGMLIIGILLSVSIYKLIKNSKNNKILGLMLFSLWFPKLLFSSSFIWDMGFWAFFAYGFLLINHVIYKREAINVKR